MKTLMTFPPSSNFSYSLDKFHKDAGTTKPVG